MSKLVYSSIKSEFPRRQVGEGGRNRYLTQHAGSLLRQGGNEDIIRAALASINKEDCTPPLPAKEVAKIAHSIFKCAQNKSSRRSNEGGAA